MNSWIDTTSALSTSIRFCLKREIFPSSLVLRPLVSLFVSKGDFSLRIDLSSTRIRFCFKREIFPFGLVFHPYVSVFVWKGRFFLLVWSFVHTYPFLFEEGDFPSRLPCRPPAYPVKMFTKNAPFQKRPPGWKLLKTPLCCIRVDRWKRRFLKTITSKCWMPVNAHQRWYRFSHYCVSVWTGVRKYLFLKDLCHEIQPN